MVFNIVLAHHSECETCVQKLSSYLANWASERAGFKIHLITERQPEKLSIRAEYVSK